MISTKNRTSGFLAPSVCCLTPVGPGTLDQELQEPKGLHQNQTTSKKPPDSKGNQEAEMAAAKGLLPHEDHRRTKS